MAKKRRSIAQIKRRILGVNLVLPGTLYARLKPCGKPNCRCASGEPEDLHGPYWEWNRRQGGRLVHKIVSEKKAKEIEKAIANRRKVEAELKEWETKSAEVILGDKRRKA